MNYELQIYVGLPSNSIVVKEIDFFLQQFQRLANRDLPSLVPSGYTFSVNAQHISVESK